MYLQLALYLLLINVVAYAAFVMDKAKARAGVRRISENTLLTLALAGGSPGAVAAQQIVRHKTRKEPFRTHLLLIAGLHAALVLAAALLGVERLLFWIELMFR